MGFSQSKPTNLVTRTETLGEVKARQTVWAEWMERSTEGLDDTDLVETITQKTAFMGSYLLKIRPLEHEE